MTTVTVTRWRSGTLGERTWRCHRRATGPSRTAAPAEGVTREDLEGFPADGGVASTQAGPGSHDEQRVALLAEQFDLHPRVTENVKDLAAEHDLVIVCVLKSRLPAQGMSDRLAELLDAWAISHPDPYVGLHWPKIGK